MKKKKVAVVFGGRSGEHVVSLRSGRSIIDAIDREKCDVIPVGITREGSWFAGSTIWEELWNNQEPLKASRAAVSLNAHQPGLLLQKTDEPGCWYHQEVDIFFPVLHGTYGEDGTIQGLFDMTGIPYVGSGVLASSTAMDKVVMKMLFREQGLPVAPFVSFRREQWLADEDNWRQHLKAELGYPMFVKPANLGSSVAVSKVHHPDALKKAIVEALLYDDKVVVERFIPGREIECSVLGDIEASASLPGEIIPCNEFYDYQAKYIDDRSELIVPVSLGKKLENRVQDYAVRAFSAVEASGLGRVDFFLLEDDTIIVNEINTIPGFTSISMYPKLWEASGLPYRTLVTRLLDIAEQRHQRRRSLWVAPPE